MENCLFCKIIHGEIPSEKVYENEFVYAFRDIHPQAPTHVLLIPKTHAASLNEADRLPDQVLLECIRAIPAVAKQEGLENGYRVSPTAETTRASPYITCISISSVVGK